MTKVADRFLAMQMVMGEERFSHMLVYMISYRSDPEFWDEMISELDDNQLAEVQAAADQSVAEFKDS